MYDQYRDLLTHWGRDEMNNISQTTFSNVFSSMKMFEFRLKSHWSMFPRVQLIIFQHWFRQWLGAVQVTSHYLDQWWLDYRRILCVTWPQWVKSSSRFIWKQIFHLRYIHWSNNIIRLLAIFCWTLAKGQYNMQIPFELVQANLEYILDVLKLKKKHQSADLL